MTSSIPRFTGTTAGGVLVTQPPGDVIVDHWRWVPRSNLQLRTRVLNIGESHLRWNRGFVLQDEKFRCIFICVYLKILAICQFFGFEHCVQEETVKGFEQQFCYSLSWHQLSLKKHDWNRRIVSEIWWRLRYIRAIQCEFGISQSWHQSTWLCLCERVSTPDMVVVYTMQCCRGDFWWWRRLHSCLVLLMYRSPIRVTPSMVWS